MRGREKAKILGSLENGIPIRKGKGEKTFGREQTGRKKVKKERADNSSRFTPDDLSRRMEKEKITREKSSKKPVEEVF